MRVSKLYAPTLREVPAEAEVVSHRSGPERPRCVR